MKSREAQPQSWDEAIGCHLRIHGIAFSSRCVLRVLIDYHSFEWYPDPMKALTPIQEKVLEALRRHADHGDPAPTYRELCAEFKWGSTGTVRDHLRALARKSYLELSGRHRVIRLREERPAIARVPLVGQVVAGIPAVSDENIEQRIQVPADWVRKGGTFFALRVVGDSMRDAGIMEGDQVIVRQQSVAADGNVVIATLEGKTTIKRLRMRGARAMLVAGILAVSVDRSASRRGDHSRCGGGI